MIRVRIDGEDRRFYRLGRWDDPVPVAWAEAISAEILRDVQRVALDASLSRFRSQGDERESDLLQGLKRLMGSKSQARVTHACRTVQGYGRSIRTRKDAKGFLVWMQQKNLAPFTQALILSVIGSAQPKNKSWFGFRPTNGDVIISTEG